MPKKNQKTVMVSMSPSELRVIAGQLSEFARKYSDIAKAVEECDSADHIMVKGVPTLYHALTRVRGAVSSAETALMRLLMQRPEEMAKAAEESAKYMKSKSKKR